MTARRCIRDLAAEGRLDPARAQGFMEALDDIEETLRQQMALAAAPARAGDELLRRAEAAAALKARRVVMMASAQQGILMRVAEADGAAAVGRVVAAHLAPDPRAPGVPAVEARYNAVLARARGEMAAMYRHFDRVTLSRTGIREPARMLDVAREAFGEATGSAVAREVAEAWSRASEYLRQRFNAAGGNIGRLERWGMPTRWDAGLVRQSGFEAWRAEMLPRLDLERMTDFDTGQPLASVRLETMMLAAFEAIRTEGWSRVRAGDRSGRGTMANHRAEHRFFVFRSAEDWLAVQQRFGVARSGADIFNLMNTHLDGMAREIAAMEILGPNPDATVRWMANLVEREAATGSATGRAWERATNLARSRADTIRTMWDLYTGRANMPINPGVAKTFGVVRATLTSAMLGSAFITSWGDVGFAAQARLLSGLPQVGLIGDYLRWLAPKGAAEKKRIARETGIMAQAAASQMATLTRYVDEAASVPGLAQRVSSEVMRASLLTRWTEVGRGIHGMEWMAALGRAAGESWDALDPAMRYRLETYGFGPERWDRLRATPLDDSAGLPVLRPDRVAARDDLPPGEADRLSTMVWELLETEGRMAVPEAGLEARAITRGGRRPGTVVNEILNSAFQFKSFPISVLTGPLARALVDGGPVSRTKAVAQLLVWTTMLGALAQQAKELANGRDPRPMADPRFWVQAQFMGGALAIYGDFLFADLSRSDTSFTETLAGPMVGTASRAARIAQRAARGLTQDDETLQRDAVRLLRSMTPGSTLWYTRAATDRLIWDEIQQMVDPDYSRSVQRVMDRARRDFGQEFWWRPDENLPGRLPDFSAALEEAP